jgi:D-3-phosphoglycerate dehydrogenase / 2-oxoglutarate reductase
MSKVLISTSSFAMDHNPHVDRLREAGIEVLGNPHGRKLTEVEIAELMDAQVIGLLAGVEPLTRAVIDAAPALKVISRCGTGLDNVDLDSVARRNIALFNTPEAPADAVAELCLGLMLMMLRRIGEVDRRLRGAEWPRLPGRLLGSQTVGLIGLGRIGKRVARLCQAFGATVLAHDPQVSAPPPGVRLLDLDALLAASDLVSLHLPYAPEHCHLIDSQAIAAMKPGALLINTARGGLIDESALAEALRDGRLGGAALDVFEDEPYRGTLTGFDNVVLTAHIGSQARECRQRMELEAAENLVTGLSGKGLISP